MTSWFDRLLGIRSEEDFFPQPEAEADWQLVATTQEDANAHIVAGRLEQHGIQTHIRRANNIASQWGMSPDIVAAARVFVRKEDVAEAQAILAEHDGDDQWG